VDILIEAPSNMSLFDIIGVKQDLQETLGKKVDIGEYAGLKPRIKDEVLSEQVQIL